MSFINPLLGEFVEVLPEVVVSLACQLEARLLRYIDIVDKYRKFKSTDIRYSSFRLPKISKTTENTKISKEYRKFY